MGPLEAMDDQITIDGSEGEGGGQMLRTALALSCVTGRPFHLEHIRAGRDRPGLLPQHLTAVHAAAAVGSATVSGAAIGSTDLRFSPSALRGGEYRFDVGTAGSTILVLQTVLPALLLAPEGSHVALEGGTHNPAAPPFEFLAGSLFPLLRGMGARVEAALERYGFYPAGGGRVVVTIEPSGALQPLTLLERAAPRVRALALVSALPVSIAERELAVVRKRLRLDETQTVAKVVDSEGPGNVLMIELESGAVTEVVTGFGMRGVSAEEVAAGACDEAADYLAGRAPVGLHLADQLLVPLALAGGGAFRTLEPTLHTRTNASVISRFLNVRIAFAREWDGAYRVSVEREPGRPSSQGSETAREAGNEDA